MRGRETGVLGGRYALERCLKERGAAQTWQARDAHTGRPVVVKWVPSQSLSEGARLQTWHEADVLSRLSSPFIPPFHQVGDDGGDLMLVRGWVEGHTLEGVGPLPWREVVGIGACLAAALQEAHAHGVLHRDIKPANIIRTEHGAALIDFGLAFSPHAHPALGAAAGTRLYMSPEQAGLVHEEVGAASDLYSLGLVLAEIATGVPVLEAPSLSELLDRMADTGHALRSLPRAFAQVLEMLLRRAPRDRYRSAAALAADLAALQSHDPSRVIVGAANIRQSLAPPLFVGRDAEVDRLVGGLREGGRTAVEGPSGIGKSRLLEETLRRAGPAVRVLRGQAAHNSTAHPLQVLDGLLLDLLAESRADETLRARLQALPADVREMIGQVAPRLAELLDVRTRGQVPAFSALELTLHGLDALLEAAHCEARPLVVLLDDAQWADPLTVALLAQLRGPRVLAAFRSDEVDDGHPLRQQTWHLHLVLAPLDDADRLRLVASMAGRLPDDIARAVAESSEGSPLWLAEVLRGLEETGALRATADGWQCRRDFESLPVSRRAAALLTRRLDALPPLLHEMLVVAAQLGKNFTLSLLAELVPHAIDPLLGEAVARYLLWVDRGADRSGFTHDRLREALQARLDEAPRRALHARAAEVLSRRDDVQPHDLAFHYLEAGDAERAFPHQLAAARDAWARLDFELAEAHFRQARATASTLEIHEGLGAVLMARAKFDEAERELLAARRLARVPYERARVHLALSKVQNGVSNWSAALDWLREGLRDLGLDSDRGPALKVAREMAVRLAQNVLPRKAWQASREVPHEVLRLIGRLLHHCYQMAANLSDLGTILWADFALINTLEAHPACPELAFGWAAHTAVVRLLLKNPRGALACGMRALELAQRFPEESYVNGLVLTRLAWLLLTLGELRTAPRLFEEAVTRLRPSGDQLEICPALYHVALASAMVGDYRRCREAATEALERSLRLNFRWVTASSAFLLAAVGGGRVPDDLLEAAVDVASSEGSVRAWSCAATALPRLAAGDLDEAARLAETALGTVSGNVNPFQVSDLCQWCATILRVCAERRADGRLARLARRAVDVGLGQSDGNPSTRPRLLREHALLCLASGRPLLARRRLRESLEEARRLGMPVEEALTLYHAGDLRQALRLFRTLDLDPSLLEETGLVHLREPEEADTWALVDRMEGIVDAAATLCGTVGRNEGLAALQGQARRLLPTRTCTVVERGEDAFSRTLISRAAERGRAVLASEGDAPSDSQLIHEVQSAVCCPVLVDGVPTAFLLAVDTEVERGVGAEEAEVAELLCALTGAALENAALEAALTDTAAAISRRTTELEGARDAQDTLLSELHHQVKNNLQLVLSLIALRPDDLASFEEAVRSLATAEPALPLHTPPPRPWAPPQRVARRREVASVGKAGESLGARFSRLLAGARDILGCHTVQEVRERLAAAASSCTRATCRFVTDSDPRREGDVDPSMRVVEVRTVAGERWLTLRDPFREHDARLLDFLARVADLAALHAKRVETLEARTDRLQSLQDEVQAAVDANAANLAALERQVREQLDRLAELARATPLARHAVAMRRSHEAHELVAFLRAVVPHADVRGATVALPSRALMYVGLVASELDRASVIDVSVADDEIRLVFGGPSADLGLVGVLAPYLKGRVETDEAAVRLTFPGVL